MALLKQVLIIDDDEVNNFICLRHIEKSGFASEATYCLGGAEALQLLESSEQEKLPDVIFLDVMMPSMDAWQFLDHYEKLAKNFEKEVKLFILTSSVYKQDIQKSSKYPSVTEYIVKPLNQEVLDRVMDKHFA